MTTPKVDNFDISDKIIDELTVQHDKLFSIRQIHSLLYDKYEEFRRLDLKRDMINKLKLAFLTIEGEYNNIYRIVKNDKHYLIWSIKPKDVIIKELESNSPRLFSENKNKEDIEIEKELDDFMTFQESKDYVKLIKEMIEQRNYSFIYDNNFIDGTNYPIHILIIHNEYELIRILDDLTHIDYTVNNKDGKSCSDLAIEANNCKILEFVMEKIYTARTTKLTKLIDTLKADQKQNYDQITNLNKTIKNLNDDIVTLKNIINADKAIEWIKNIIIVVAAYFYYVK